MHVVAALPHNDWYNTTPVGHICGYNSEYFKPLELALTLKTGTSFQQS